MEWHFIIPVLLVGFPVVSYVAYRREKNLWNGGICPQTGQRWVSFDMDSQGGRGYKSGDYRIWISYPGIDSKVGC